MGKQIVALECAKKKPNEDMNIDTGRISIEESMSWRPIHLMYNYTCELVEDGYADIVIKSHENETTTRYYGFKMEGNKYSYLIKSLTSNGQIAKGKMKISCYFFDVLFWEKAHIKADHFNAGETIRIIIEDTKKKAPKAQSSYIKNGGA